MSAKKLVIGIVGAGTAGLASAVALARAGHEVHVFEKHPALATMGAGLLIQPQGVRALGKLGVGREFVDASVPVKRLLGSCHRGWTLVDVPYRDSEARGVSRPALARLLFNAAEAAGVRVHFGAQVTGVGAAGARGVIFLGEDRVLFDLVVLADGAASALPAQAGLAVSSTQYKWGALWGLFEVEGWAGEQVLEQRFQTTRKMFGLMPTERVGNSLRLSLFWSLPCAEYDAWKASSLEEWKQELLSLWPASAPVVEQITSHQQLTLATYRHAHARSLAKPPICVVGDAAHAMSPQLGLGTTLAVQDALLLARAVAAHGPVSGPLAYSRRRLPWVRAYQFLSWMLTPCFQADSGGLWRDAGFALGLKVPGMRHLMYRSIAEPRRCSAPGAAAVEALIEKPSTSEPHSGRPPPADPGLAHRVEPMPRSVFSP